MLPGSHFTNDIVTRDEFQLVYIPEIFFSPTLKLDLYNIKSLSRRHIHVAEPVKNIHFIASASSAGSFASTSGNGCTITAAAPG
jgi:hypothetical protein